MLLTGQVTHPVAARLDWAYVPAKQAVQALLEDAPTVFEYIPALHDEQADMFAALEYWPAGQTVQTLSW